MGGIEGSRGTMHLETFSHSGSCKRCRFVAQGVEMEIAYTHYVFTLIHD